MDQTIMKSRVRTRTHGSVGRRRFGAYDPITKAYGSPGLKNVFYNKSYHYHGIY